MNSVQYSNKGLLLTESVTVDFWNNADDKIKLNSRDKSRE